MSLTQLFREIEQQEWINLPDGWLQGRTIFGGLAAGVLMHKALCTVQDKSKRLLSCSITFVGPVQAGKARLTAEILRQGKSVTTLEVRLWQDDAVQTILIASFGTERESDIYIHKQAHTPDYPVPDQLKALPFVNMMPECYQHFDLRWAEGLYPLAGQDQPDFGGWVRFQAGQYANRPMSWADFLLLTDIWPPGVLPMFKQLAPASSLTWHLTFIQPIQQQLQDWLKYKVVTEHAEHGYSTEYAHVWNDQNQLLAICRQTVTVFA